MATRTRARSAGVQKLQRRNFPGKTNVYGRMHRLQRLCLRLDQVTSLLRATARSMRTHGASAGFAKTSAQELNAGYLDECAVRQVRQLHRSAAQTMPTKQLRRHSEFHTTVSSKTA